MSNNPLLSVSSNAQRKRILSYFESISPRLTVSFARHELAILNLPARIFEMRQEGYDIPLVWVYESDKFNALHRVGEYFYAGRKRKKQEKRNERYSNA